MGERPNIPEKIKRQLRKESSFGCAICGNPLIVYHHIIPLKEQIHNNPKHMITLCRNCHELADNETIKRNRLYKLKKTPYNKDKTKDRFIFESKIPGLLLGSVLILLIKNLINFDGKTVLSMNVLPSGFLQLNAKIYDINGKFIASIDKNEWVVYTSDVWDIKYNGKLLKIWNEKRKIGFELKYNPKIDLISINGRFCFQDKSVSITKEKGICFEQANSGFHNLAIVGPGQNIKLEGGTIFRINFPAKNLVYVPITKNQPPKNSVICFGIPKDPFNVDTKTKKIHLQSCRYITSQIVLDHSKKKVYPDGIISIPNKPKPPNIIYYDSIVKAEKDGYEKCKICL